MPPHETPREELELSPGDRCEGYRIVALLAAGGMGEVYEAVHEPSGRTVAVKCLKVRHRNKEDARARMKMEAVVLSELQHENLVQVYDAGVTDSGMVWIAMERLHGQTLRDLLFRKGRLPISEALHYASEIADGVDAVHDVNVIHRDLKPENVFVTTSNVVKVLDLGTGKFTGYGLNSTDRMRVVGTTAYMSPEQIKGLRVDGRADVYALGLIVYEMIAGRHALTPEDGAALPQGVEQIALMQLQMSPQKLARVAPSCPPYVSAMVERAIAKDRDRRFPNMATFARELRSLRKRFVAEHPSDGGGLAPFGEDLREKFGAPPRQSDRAPRRASASAPAPSSAPSPDIAADDAAARQIDGDYPTEIQPAVAFTLDPAAAYVPTQILSSTSVPLPPVEGAANDFTQRSLPPEEVRNRTTQTNPIGFVRAASSSSDDSFEVMLRGRSLHPMMKRIGVTLALGALIGVPPAVGGVLWARYRNGFSRAGVETSSAEKPGTPAVVKASSIQPSGAVSVVATVDMPAPSIAPTSPKTSDAPEVLKSRAKPPQSTSLTASAWAGASEGASAPMGTRTPSEGVLVRPPRAKSKSAAVPSASDANVAAAPDPRPPGLAVPVVEEDSSKTVLPPSGL